MKPFEVQTEEQWTLPREGAGALHVRTPSGDIRVEGAETEQLEVRVVRQVRSGQAGAAEAFLEQMRIERRREEDRWVIVASWPEPRLHHVESPQAQFEIRLPAGMRLEAQSGHGSVTAGSVAEARLRSGSGDIRAARVAAGLEANTGHGSIRVEECGGATIAQSSSGDVTIRRAHGRVRATTGHGSIRIEDCSGPAEVESGSGDVHIREVPAPVEAVSGHGRIEVTGVQEARLRTGSGDLHARRVAGPLNARTGHGRIEADECAGPLDADTSSGDIILRRVESVVTARTGHGAIRVSDVPEVHLRSGSGDLHVANAAGDLEAHTGHGCIRVDACAGAIAAEASSGGIEIRRAQGAVRAATGHGHLSVEVASTERAAQVELAGNGPIDLSLPQDVSARLEASTSAGVIESDPAVGGRLDPRRTRLEAVLGAGEGSVRLRTSHGTIRVRMAG